MARQQKYISFKDVDQEDENNILEREKPKLKSHESQTMPAANSFNPFLGTLNITSISKQDVFKDRGIYNECFLDDGASRRHQRIFQFIDDELDLKLVNIKELLES